MKTQLWIRLVTFIVTAALLFQNASALGDALGPISAFLEEVSRLDTETGSTASGIIVAIRKYNNFHPSTPISSVGDLYVKLLERDEYKIRSDLKGHGINIVYRRVEDDKTDLPDRIEFIGQRFTLTFTDAGISPKGIVQAKIPGTNMVIVLDKRIDTLEQVSDILNAFKGRFVNLFKGNDSYYFHFVEALKSRYGTDSEEECLTMLFREIIANPEPIKFPRADYTYPDGVLGFEIVAYLLYEAEKRGVISEEELFRNLQKYSDFVIRMEHQAYLRRPPLREELQTVDIRYSYYADGIGDLSRSVAVAKMVRRNFPDVKVRFYYLSEHEKEIKIFFPQYIKGENTVVSGIEIIPEEELTQDGDIALFSDNLRLTDEDNHSPVQIVVSEYGFKPKVEKGIIYAPSITAAVPTGPDLGLFLNPEVDRLKEWYEHMSEDERHKEKIRFIKRVINNYTSYAGISDSQAERIAASPWAFAYAFSVLGFNPFLEAYREAGINKPYFMFVFGNKPYEETMWHLDFVRNGLNVISVDPLTNEDFIKLMLFCDLPCIVTGGGSLTEAMQIGKPFVYEVREHKLSLKDVSPFYFLEGVDNSRQKEALKEFIRKHYPHYPRWDFALPSVEEKIVEAVRDCWAKHTARIDDARFRRLYDDIHLRLLGAVIPEAFSRYLPKQDTFWADVFGAEKKAIDEFLGNAEKVYTVEEVKNILTDENIEPNSYFVVRASDSEVVGFIRSIPNLELRVKGIPDSEELREKIRKHVGDNWEERDLRAELAIFRINGTNYWIFAKGTVDKVEFQDNIDELRRKGILKDFIHFHALVKGRRMAYMPSSRDITSSFLSNGMLYMVAEEGLLQLDISGLKASDGSFWMPDAFESEFEKLWGSIREKMFRERRLDIDALKKLGIEAKFLSWDEVNEHIFITPLGIKGLLESAKPIHQIIGLVHLFNLLGEDAVQFISGYIREKDEYFKNEVFKRLIGTDINMPIIKLLFALLNDSSIVIRLKALRILFAIGVIDESMAGEIIKKVIEKEGIDRVKDSISHVGSGRWLSLLREEMGEGGNIETLCSGRIIPDTPGYSPFVVKSTISSPEITVDEGKVIVTMDGDELGRISLEEWELLKQGNESLETRALVDKINGLMIERLIKHVDTPDNHIEVVYDELGVKLKIGVEKELLEMLFGANEDMDMAVAEFFDRLRTALKMETSNGVDITRLEGEEPIRFAIVNGFSHLGGDGVRNRAVLLHSVLGEMRRKDKDIFDAYVEMLIAHELGLHEARDIKPEDIVKEEEKRIDIDVDNFFSALMRRQKGYEDIERILGPFIGLDNEFLLRLKGKFFDKGAYLPARIEEVRERKIGDLFKEVIKRNLGGVEIIKLFLGEDPYFSTILDLLYTALEDEPARFSSMERDGRLDDYIFRLAKYCNLIGIPSGDELSRIFPDYPNLASSLAKIYRETLPDEWKQKYGLEMELVAVHACRVARIASLIAGGMGDKVSITDTKNIILAALLHDIGKGKVIDIISCPRNLTPEEFKRVNQHAEESISQLDSLLDRILKTKPYEGRNRISLPKEVLETLKTSVDFREAIRYHHAVGNISGDSEGSGRLIAEILMAADVLDALLDASRPYILQGGDVKSVEDALDILVFMKDKTTGRPLIRDEIRSALKRLYETKDTQFMDTITDTHRFPRLYNAIVLATILPNGIGPMPEMGKDGEGIYDAILIGIAHSNLDIRSKAGLAKRLKEIAEQITGYRDAIVRQGVAIDTIALDKLLVINSGLRLDLTRDAKEKIENGGVVILKGEKKDIAEAYKVLLGRLKAVNKLQFERNILVIEIDERQNVIAIRPARQVVYDEFLLLLGKSHSFQEALDIFFGKDTWIYQNYFEEFIQRVYPDIKDVLNRLLTESKTQDSQWLVRDNIATALNKLINEPSTNWLTRILAWHLLVRLGECKEPQGIVIYSLTDFLESKPATDGNIDALKRLIRDTKGRVFFYTSKGYDPAEGFEFLKERIITSVELESNGIAVYMVNDLDRRSLGLNDFEVGKLDGNKVLVPLKGQRNPEDDIFLGLEIVRNEGNVDKLPPIFEKMLKEMIEEYLIGQGEKPSPERVKAIYETEPLPGQVEDSYEEIRKVIASA